MSNYAAGGAYAGSAASIIAGILSHFTYEEWNAIGVLVGIIVGLLSYATGLYFQIREARRKDRESKGGQK